MYKKKLNYPKKGISFGKIKRRLLDYARGQEYRYTRSFNFFRDINNRVKYGSSSPVFAERIWVNPQLCSPLAITGFDQKYSGKVIETSWPIEEAIPVNKIPKLKFCVAHWVNGYSWEDTGAYEHWLKRIPWTDTTSYSHMKKIDNSSNDKEPIDCRSMGYSDRLMGKTGLEPIKRRYDELDKIIAQVKQDGRLKTRREINAKNYLESGGILIHIGPNGTPYFSGGGIHRFAISLILKLPVIPAQIGCVHKSAIPFLDKYRKREKDDNA